MKKRKNITVMASITPKVELTKTDLKDLIVLEDYSELKRLLRVTAYVFQFVFNLKRSLRNKPLVLDEVQQTEVDKAKVLGRKKSKSCF